MTTQTVPKGFVRAYLRASTTEQDATRALDTINTFAVERGLSICNYYIENEGSVEKTKAKLYCQTMTPD
jgi:DNA invertase Pin-like site-specific DNA recombinase